ncbi:uncharacterized protein [Amphiura filiformis]|uniref:uncharacterized protein n=1 Tax=Amphiura filiformis TaxID=82378 RepID=UPI003B20B5BB
MAAASSLPAYETEEQIIRVDTHGGIITKLAKVKLVDSENRSVMLKILLLINTKNVESFKKEILITSQLDHKNISKFIADGNTGDRLAYMVEYASDKSLRELIKDNPDEFDIPKFFTLAPQAACAVDYLHSLQDQVIHGDLRSSNFFLTAKGILKLFGFGFAKVHRNVGVVGDFTTKESPSEESRVRWQAPEALGEERTVSPKSDIWSLCCFFSEMLVKVIPFHDLESGQLKLKLMAAIRNNTKPFDLSSHETDLRQFVEKGYHANPEERHDIKAVLSGLEELKEYRG